MNACRAALLAVGMMLGQVQPALAAAIDIPGPTGSSIFGRRVLALSNGNIVVSDPEFESGRGAVYLYRPNRQLISVLQGAAAGDNVGWDLVKVGNGNFLVVSPFWSNGTAAAAGAVTWVDGDTGLSGFVSAGNSLVGNHPFDRVATGSAGITVLANGHYVVRSVLWDNGAAIDAGAATWGDGNAGVRGLVAAGNSLVGTQNNDQVSSNGVLALSNGHYVVCSSDWSNAAVDDVGAVTWGNGSTGVRGTVSVDNSLVGTQPDDSVGSDCATALRNGHYVVRSSRWANAAVDNAGAVTWGNGNAGTVGAVSAGNSLVGTHPDDDVGYTDVVSLSNGHYVVVDPLWDNGSIVNAGAVTWGNGNGGTVGAISAGSSLVGMTEDERVGFPGATALVNGNYVVATHLWNNGSISNAGAATWGNGNGGTVGTISTSNSLVGNKTSDNVADGGVVALSNGNYVVVSYLWSNGSVPGAGAVSWGNGATGTTGIVSAVNSLVGGQSSDQIGVGGITPLSNGHYLVLSPGWNNGASTDVGAITWRPGNASSNGEVSTSNSVTGVITDSFSQCQLSAMPGEQALAACPNLNGDQAGAVFALSGSSATPIGPVPGSAITLFSVNAGDRIGSYGVSPFGNRYYLVRSPDWSNDRGAMTVGRLPAAVAQLVNASNSVLGTAPNGGAGMATAYDIDRIREIVVVGRAADNIVTMLDPNALMRDGFEEEPDI